MPTRFLTNASRLSAIFTASHFMSPQSLDVREVLELVRDLYLSRHEAVNAKDQYERRAHLCRSSDRVCHWPRRDVIPSLKVPVIGYQLGSASSALRYCHTFAVCRAGRWRDGLGGSVVQNPHIRIPRCPHPRRDERPVVCRRDAGRRTGKSSHARTRARAIAAVRRDKRNEDLRSARLPSTRRRPSTSSKPLGMTSSRVETFHKTRQVEFSAI